MLWCVVLCLVSQSHMSLCDLMDYSLPVSSVHGSSLSMGILQARIQEWAAMPYYNPGIEPRSITLQADSLLSDSPRKSKNTTVGSLSLLQGSSWYRNYTWVSCIASRNFTSWVTREASVVMVVDKSLINLVRRLEDKSSKSNYNYNNSLMDIQGKKGVNCDIKNIKLWVDGCKNIEL